jgi:hypothetical protein
MATLSLRRLWAIYKRTAVKSGSSKRERIGTQLAFYSGARGVLKVLAHLIEHGYYEELHGTIRSARAADRQDSGTADSAAAVSCARLLPVHDAGFLFAPP